MIISTNIPALQATTNLGKTNAAIIKAQANLSIGTRINSAKDDAAGLAIVNKLKTQITGLNVASQNSMDGISLLQTAEGALSEISSMLIRMRELSVQAANDTNTPEDRVLIAKEYENLREEISEISWRTEFNKIKLLGGDLYKYKEGDEDKWGPPEYLYDSLTVAAGPPHTFDISQMPMSNAQYLRQFQNDATLQVGANMTQELNISIPKLTASTLNLPPWPGIRVEDVNNPDYYVWFSVDNPLVANIPFGPGTDDYNYEFSHRRATDNLAAVDRAVDIVSGLRAELGAGINRLEHTILSLDTTSLNTDRSRSRLEDTDMAMETTIYSSKQVIAQAAIAIIAQANQRPQTILQLL